VEDKTARFGFMKSLRSILIVQTAYAGDAVLVTPMIAAVRSLFLEAAVDVMLRPEAAALFRHNPRIRNVLAYDKRRADRGMAALWKWAGRLRRTGYDAALVPHRSIRSALLVFLAGIPRRVGFKRSAGFFLFTDAVPYPGNVHEVHRNLELVRVLGWRGRASAPELFPGPEEKASVLRFLRERRIRRGERLLAMAPGSLWATKRWPAERYAALAAALHRRHRIRTILIGGSDDAALAEGIRRSAGEGIETSAGRFSLLESAELIRRCGRLLTNDSAPLHLASAVGTPAAAIFGPTVEGFGFGPFGANGAVIQKKLDCRPCSAHGTASCPRGHFRCMLDISVEEVAGVVMRRLFGGKRDAA
jgi:heptosyltransferase II